MAVTQIFNAVPAAFEALDTTIAQLHDPCTSVIINCTTAIQFQVFDCELGELEKVSDNCNQTAELTCTDDEICEPNCKPSHDLVYDYRLRKCVARIGKSCAAQRLCQENAVCFSSAPLYSSRRLLTCQCSPGTQLVNNQCIRTEVYGKKCGNESPIPLAHRSCDSNASITCLNGTCQCENSNQTYSSITNRCHVPPGSPCNAVKANCIPNAYCGYSGCSCIFPAIASVEKGICVYKRPTSGCRTNDPFFQCDSDLNLECINNICTCKEGFLWDTASRCSILAGRPCNINPESRNNVNITCVSNAICWDGECHCKDGYSRTNAGFCSLSIGQPCNHTGLAFECNKDHGLACVEAKCACSDYHTQFNPVTSYCEEVDLPIFEEEPISSKSNQHVGDSKEADPDHTNGFLVAFVWISVIVLFGVIFGILFKKRVVSFIRNF